MEAVVIGLVLGSGYLLSLNEKQKQTQVKPKRLPTRPVKESRRNDTGHSNMKPFFGSTVKQNIDPHANDQLLDFMVGAGSVAIGKREMPQMFNREQSNIGTPNGAPNTVEQQREHYNIPRVRQNELPFEQIKVGPGMGKGYTSTPAGKIQNNFDIRDAELRRYKTVDETRTATNPKMVFPGVPMNPESHIKRRGVVGEVKHRHPDRFYMNENGERNLITTGAYMKPRIRPEVIQRDVSRPSTTREYFGTRKSASTYSSYINPDTKTSPFRTQLPGPSMGPSVRSTVGHSAGRDGYQVLPNQRTITESRTKYGPASSSVYTVPLQPQDKARFTRKEYFEGAARQFGNMQSTFPKNLPAFNPYDTARTTIREQTEERNWVAPGKIDVTKHQTRDSTKNMRQNVMKEKTLKGRAPAKQGNKNAVGKESIRITTRKIQSDLFSKHEPMPTKVRHTTPSKSLYGNMRLNNRQGVSVNVDRNDPSMVSALRGNPLAISLASAAAK